MQPESLKLLEDIRDAAAFIVEISGHDTLDSYSSNRVLRQAIERNFEIIGGAVIRLRREDATTADLLGDTRAIIAFRNVLIHGYDSVENAVVWDVIRFKLPTLLAQVAELVKRRTTGE